MQPWNFLRTGLPFGKHLIIALSVGFLRFIEFLLYLVSKTCTSPLIFNPFLIIAMDLKQNLCIPTSDLLRMKLGINEPGPCLSNRQAAVLIAITEDENPKLLLIRRSS